MRWVRFAIIELAFCCGAWAASYMGIGVADQPGGVEVVRVEEGSPAAVAGLRVGDLLVAYNGQTIAGGLQMAKILEQTPVGRHVKIQFMRDGKPHFAEVVTVIRPGTEDTGVWPRFPADVPSPLLVWKNNLFGFESETLDVQLAGYFGAPGGLLVRSVERGSPAETSGLRAGDVIVTADDRPLLTSRDITSLLRSDPGRSIRLKIIREHKWILVALSVPG